MPNRMTWTRTMLLTLTLAGCSDPLSPPSVSATTTATGSDPAASAGSPPDTVTCHQHYRELREGILGALRGTETLPLLSVVTTYAEGVRSAPAAGTGPADLSCNAESRSLRRKRTPNTAAGWPLAPACDALLQRIDRTCLQPLIDTGTPFSPACTLALNGIASASGEQQQNMGNAGLCESAGRELGG